MTTRRAPAIIIPRAFPGITPDEVQELVSNSQVNRYESGTVLCLENAFETTFYLILEGEVDVTKVINQSQTRHLQTLEAGDFFGEMGIIHNAPRAATVTAKSDIVVLELDKDSFDSVLKHSSSIALAMVREISNRLRENDEMAIEDLRLRASELAQAYQKLAEQEVARREFLTNVAHELRTPLMSASGYLQILQKGTNLKQEKLDQALSVISRNVHQIVTLVNDILFLQEMDLVLPEFQPVDMAKLATSIIDDYKSKALKNGIRLSLSKDRNLTHAAGDTKSLEHALGAIVDNAIKFSPNGGTVIIHLKNVGEQVCITVEDFGIGISEEARPHIFERFFHIDESDDALFGGIGLGLAISRQVIEQHNGTLEVESELGKGSTFTMCLQDWKSYNLE